MKQALKWFLYLLFGSWAVVMLFGSLIARLIGVLRPPTRRVCPKCGYRTVQDIALRPRDLKDGEPLAYARCTACQQRYKHWGAGPFHSVTDEEWAAIGRFPFGPARR